MNLESWEREKHDLTGGYCYPINKIPEKQHHEMPERNIGYGNHAKGPEAEARLEKLNIGDVTSGFGLPLTLDAVQRLLKAKVFPMGNPGTGDNQQERQDHP